MSMTDKRARENSKMMLRYEDQSKLHGGLLSSRPELGLSAMASRSTPAELRTNKRCPALVFPSALFTGTCTSNTVENPEN